MLSSSSLMNPSLLIFNFYRPCLLNGPFYSCLLSDVAFEWQPGCKWPCFDKDLTAFVV